ncbi:hypothetical protein BY458DRAFT_184661 [Sporodiniella umbellata]|nr:hypothetical protein BY458DRAFT_184661 [Sporodiniella umbellata]
MERLDPSSSNDKLEKSESMDSNSQTENGIEEKGSSTKRRKSIFSRRRSSAKRRFSTRKPSTASRGSNQRRDSNGTLIEAALDQAEAKERHVRFGDHITEAGNLVQRMLSTRIGNDINHTSSVEEYPDYNNESDEDSFIRPMNTGSVLASLMKLESQRRQAWLTQQ